MNLMRMNNELAANTTLSHYRIVRKLGAGGMGEVWLAEDTRLKRKVALKLLPAELTSDADRVRRFEQEAQAASALNHPNILTIYEIGEINGSHYIATEYIEGETLRHHLQHSRRKLREILETMVQVASALSTAHQAGIVHRDLKPENVMLRPDGIVKVLDFGLAKLTEKSAPTTDTAAATIARQATDPGVVMGTVLYMSPEQARGKTVDARSDIFSLGIVLYELVAGRAPFTGESSSDVLAAILDKEPPPLLRFMDEVPPELQRIVTKCLRKERDERYQTMKDVLLDLKELRDELALATKLERSIRPANNSAVENQRTLIADAEITQDQSAQLTGEAPVQTTSSAEYLVGEIRQHKRGVAIGLLGLLLAASGLAYWYFSTRSSSAKQIESIAVMPFSNESGNPEVDYLSDGMTETLINSLSQIPNLSVKARASVFRYKGKEFDPKQIASELKVQAILMGRVVQRGSQVTLNLELIDAQTENTLWGNKYERKSSDLVSLQSEITRDVSNRLKPRLSGADAMKVEKTYTANTEAYQLYLQGRFYGSKRTAKDAQKSIDYFQQAAALDPNYALAFAGLAESNWFLAVYSYPQINDVIPRARELALKALELDNSLAEPHSILGVICYIYDRDFACNEREQKLAIELNPNYSESHRRYGLLLKDLGRFEEARIAFKRALEIDPLSPVTNFQTAQLLFNEKKYEESETQGKKNVELDPNFWYAHLQLFYVYRMKRDYASAVEELAKVQDARGEPDAAQLIRESFARGDWQGFLRKITGERTRLKLYPYFVAAFFAELGEKDKAFAVLNEALETKDQHTAWMKVDPYMDPLRDDPRFQEVLKKAGFSE